MSSNEKPVIASVGAGMMGQLAHIGNYARLRDDGRCTIAGVTDLQRDLAEAVAERYRIPRVYASIDELLADPDVDGVTCIQQWPNNYPLVKQILSAGKSVITEKPMVGRLDEAEELVALAKANNVLYAVGFMKRYDLGVEIAKQILQGRTRIGIARRVADGRFRLQRRRLAAECRSADPGRRSCESAAVEADLSRCLQNQRAARRLRLARQHLFAHRQPLPSSS